MEDSFRDFDKQTEDLLIPKYYYIELLQDGSFPKPTDQVHPFKNIIKYIFFIRSTPSKRGTNYASSFIPVRPSMQCLIF
jgi:hypothetical protein